jgi:hypothetical protein
MATKPVRINTKVLNKLYKKYGEMIEEEYGIKPTDTQLILIMFHHSQGKEVNIKLKKGKLVINAV